VCQLDPAPCWTFTVIDRLAICLAAPIVKGLAGELGSKRLALIADGSEPAGAEAVRMVSEKMSAALEVQHAVAVAAMTGNAGLIPARTLAICRRMIRANRHRLGAAETPPTGIAGRGIKRMPT
jgi:hypothetical protein